MAMAVHTTIPGKKVKKGDGGNMAVRCKQLIFNSFDIHLTIMIQFKINKAIETPHSKVDNPECRDPTSPKQHTLYIWHIYYPHAACVHGKISPVFTSSHLSLPPSTRKKTPSFPILAATTHLQRTLDLARISNRFVSHLDPWNTQFLDFPKKNTRKHLFLA